MCIIVVESAAGVTVRNGQLPHHSIAEVARRREVVRWVGDFDVRDIEHARQPTLVGSQQIVVPEIVMAYGETGRTRAVVRRELLPPRLDPPKLQWLETTPQHRHHDVSRAE